MKEPLIGGGGRGPKKVSLKDGWKRLGRGKDKSSKFEGEGIIDKIVGGSSRSGVRRPDWGRSLSTKK